MRLFSMRFTKYHYLPVVSAAIFVLILSACMPITPAPADETPAVQSSSDTSTEEATEEPSEESTEGETALESNATWQLVEYLGPDGTMIEPTVPATISFADGQVSGSSGCNSFSAAYTVNGDELTVGPAASTMMACEEAVMDQEQLFLENLGKAASYELVEDQLNILDAEGNVLLTFEQGGAEAAEGAEAAPLSGILTGTVSYMQRIALIPGSVIEVKIEDTSVADVAAPVIASQTITTTGENVPIPFELSYDPAQIDPQMSYSMRARITVNGELQWINTVNIPVLTQGAPVTDVEVLVEQVQ
jgi:uncharacterized lipoprotein YbaY